MWQRSHDSPMLHRHSKRLQRKERQSSLWRRMKASRLKQELDMTLASSRKGKSTMGTRRVTRKRL